MDGQFVLNPVLVDARAAAEMLGISARFFATLEASGRIGPLPVCFGKRRLYCVDELRRWATAGCPSRQEWKERQQ